MSEKENKMLNEDETQADIYKAIKDTFDSAKAFIPDVQLEGTMNYLGIFNVLDELTSRIKDCKDIDDVEKYCNMYVEIYKLLK